MARKDEPFVITAKRDGWCWHCRRDIGSGQRIICIDDGWRHIACTRSPDCGQPRPAEPEWSVTATWDGHCWHCGTPVTQGQQVTKGERGWQHYGCLPSDETLSLLTGTCAHCDTTEGTREASWRLRGSPWARVMLCPDGLGWLRARGAECGWRDEVEARRQCVSCGADKSGHRRSSNYCSACWPAELARRDQDAAVARERAEAEMAREEESPAAGRWSAEQARRAEERGEPPPF
jgi:hypothetical protein